MAVTIGFCWQTWGGGRGGVCGGVHTGFKVFCWSQESITQALLLLAAVSKTGWNTAFLFPCDIVYWLRIVSGTVEELSRAV